MTRVVLANYVGTQTEEGMDYVSIPQSIFGDTITGWTIQDVTEGSPLRPADNRRVWLITNLSSEGLTALEANSLCEIVA